MKTFKKKTVFILGAGFSKSDNIPLQSELLKDIFLFQPDESTTINNIIDLSINEIEQKVMNYYDNFNKSRLILADFLVNNFSSNEKRTEFNSAISIYRDDLPQTYVHLKRAYEIASEVDVTLEDLFTIFDKVILGHEHYGFYSIDINKIDIALKFCIIFILSYNCAQISKNETSISRLFSRKIFDMYINRKNVNDELSIISMNWDSLLEKELFILSNEYNSNKPRKKIFPDLCFYDNLYKENDKRPISTHVKAKGYINIKLLKLHGSINWLSCTYCNRIFVDYNEDIALNELSIDCSCPECKKNKMLEITPQMNNIIITPTFLKNLNNLHIKNIWHNAFIELIEANKIVFIGYSFPDADFEMRYLLKKAVQPNTRIEVVLHQSDNPDYYSLQLKKYKLKKNDHSVLLGRLYLPEKRYKSFFGDKEINFYYNGIEGYIKKERENE